MIPAGAPVLSGGHTDYPVLDSDKRSTKTNKQWGFDGASSQLLGHMRDYNPHLNGSGYLRYWAPSREVLGTVPYTPLLGGRMEFWNGGHRDDKHGGQRETANRWPEGQTGGGAEVKWADYTQASRPGWAQPWADSFLTFKSH